MLAHLLRHTAAYALLGLLVGGYLLAVYVLLPAALLLPWLLFGEHESRHQHPADGRLAGRVGGTSGIGARARAMSQLLARLGLCWRILRARRFVAFLPAWPTMYLTIGGPVPPNDWEAIVHFAQRQHALAQDEADARLLAKLRAQAVAAAQQALVEEARRLVKQV